MQMIFLGLLVDMTDEGDSVSHMLCWRGKEGYGVLSLFVEIWKSEELLSQTQRTEEGCIKGKHSNFKIQLNK